MEELVLTAELIELCSLNCLLFEIYRGKPPGTQASIIRCLSQARIHWEGCGKKGIQRKKMGDDGGGGTDSLDGVSSRRIAGAIFPCTIKSRRWRAVMEAVAKGCSEFCVTVGTATRTANPLTTFATG